MKVNVTLFVTVLALVAGCKPDYDAPCRGQAVKIKNNFTTEQQASIPYGSADSTVFVSVSGDTLWMNTQTYISDYTYLPSVVIGNPGCPADVDGFQQIQVKLMDTLSAIGIQGLWKKETDSCWYVVAEKKFATTISQLGDSTHAMYADSVELNQKMFYKVSTFYSTEGDSILLTQIEGVVYFTDGVTSDRLESFKGR